MFLKIKIAMIFENKEQCLEHLRTHYFKLNSGIAYSGINQIYNFYNKKLPISTIEEFLSSVLSYTIHKETHKRSRNPFYAFYPRFQVKLISFCLRLYNKFTNIFISIYTIVSDGFD